MKKLLLAALAAALPGFATFSATAQIADPAPMASSPKVTKEQRAAARKERSAKMAEANNAPNSAPKKAKAPASASSDAEAAKAKRQAEARAANKPGEIPDAVMRGTGISAHKP